MSKSLKDCGITKKRIELFEKINIRNADELFSYYPFRYENLDKSVFKDWNKGDKVVFEATLISYPSTYRYSRLKSITKFKVFMEDNELEIVIYNRPWTSNLKINQKLVIVGKYEGLNKVTALNYSGKSIDDIVGITPVYSTTKDITQKIIHETMKKAFENSKNDITNDIPFEYLSKYKLLNKVDAIRKIHFPQTMNDVSLALRTLKYEEFLKFYIAINLLKKNNDNKIVKNSKKFNYDDVFSLVNNLSFTLTKDQFRSVNEILDDLQSNKIMYRLLQGDVGSGKTLVAALGLYATYLSNEQSALLAPTEILAKQHYESLNQLFKPTGLKIKVLYSSMNSQVKKDILKELINGEIDILIGTHAIIQENVVFKNLGMVVADEQHRFGVEQRKKLLEKGEKVDFLLMSATPIPRTLAITLYGDMDISTIETMPSNRKPVKTVLIQENSFYSVINDIEEKLNMNEQIYIICSIIEENENFDARNTIDVYENLKKYFNGRYNVGLLHGKMSPEEKEDVMNLFSNNKIQILISTTVIEVGINVPNASVIIIYDAHRFGLSQLHQLRGRIQRGDKQGVCYLLTDNKNKESINRLKVLLKTNNGFDISSEDLRLRGPGDILGTRQSGVPSFILGDLFEDTKIINQARIDANEIIKNQNVHDNKKIVDSIISDNDLNITYMD
ncbi:MAG: ATP-dependent DNA helicase RecG [Erysipelotrichaceae bacterium]|nr:ATP-dependent DNA helicase RecG [Erysipelotrichaceae bacterium]